VLRTSDQDSLIVGLGPNKWAQPRINLDGRKAEGPRTSGGA